MQLVGLKNFTKLIIVVVVFLPTFVLESLVLNTNTNDKDNIIESSALYISAQEKLNTKFDKTELVYLDFMNKIDAEISFPITSFYKISTWALDYFTFDFSETPAQENTGFFYNYFNFGIDNYFEIKKYVTIELTMDMAVSSLSAHTTVLEFYPASGVSGNYYFGFSWQLTQAFPVYHSIEAGQTEVLTNTGLTLSYEFFRFYGPKEFKFSLVLNEDIYYSLTDKYIDNIFQAGIEFNFKNITPEIFFMIEAYYNPADSSYNNTYLGLVNGITYRYKRFTFALDYTGKINSSVPNSPWQHLITTSVRFNLITKPFKKQ